MDWEQLIRCLNLIDTVDVSALIVAACGIFSIVLRHVFCPWRYTLAVCFVCGIVSYMVICKPGACDHNCAYPLVAFALRGAVASLILPCLVLLYGPPARTSEP